ncbi:response regulator transcription factor [Sediminibacterium sp.]|uniref:response regulator transcription factor n=1 Tax=Sediminibacterium sp. TaxID=1917865 RepID=UPI0025ED1948|nr:response regulator transcription factor [Sediminibacterium sp.]MBW0177394.1 response regulator transcription factor [Sediminibacterium sp.]
MFKKYQLLIWYGLSLALLLALLRWMELKYLLYEHAFEVYAVFIAVFFLIIGIWLSKKLTRPKIRTEVMEKIVYRDTSLPFELNQKLVYELGISSREMEVLQLMATGLSNQEIAAQLFVSPNTIKTHLARLFEKLDVGKRVQAIEKAKRLGLIP